MRSGISSTNTSRTSQEPEMSTHKTLDAFLTAHKIKKEDKTTPTTNTRIPSDDTYGGKYHIPDAEYQQFLQLYYREVIQKQKKEYLTETQLKVGPILVDLDFRYNTTVTTRQFNDTHIEYILRQYYNILHEIHQFSEDPAEIINVFVMTKPDINVLTEQNIVKDGIHIIIGLQTDHTAQLYIRKRMIEIITDQSETNPIRELPLINTWEQVFDKGISAGTTSWQLFGSRKPNHETYDLVALYHWTHAQRTKIPLKGLRLDTLIEKLSARYAQHPCFFETAEYEQIMSSEKEDEKTKDTDEEETDTEHEQSNTPLGSLPVRETISPNDVFKYKTVEAFDEYFYGTYLQNRAIFGDWHEYIEYTLILPNQYWGIGSYEKWIRVGWALQSINTLLFAVWVKFSAQSPVFSMADVGNMYDQWKNFNTNKGNTGFTKRSLIYWAKEDAPAEYNKIRIKNAKTIVDRILLNYDTVGDYQFAQMLHMMNKDKFVCVSPDKNVWYEFKGHHWTQVDSASTLRIYISEDMRLLFEDKMFELELERSQQQDEDAKKTYTGKIKCVKTIMHRLVDSAKKSSLMKEAKDLFYVPDFYDLLDTKLDLICFNNGVLDTEKREFRDGSPLDYISFCTNIDYIPYERINPTLRDEITEFFQQVFPIQELCEYMWQHLASCVSGRVLKAYFHIYIGVGSNGKTKITELMEKTFGDYCGPGSKQLILGKEPKIGGTNPELLAIKGVRYLIFTEFSKGDVLNEGLMKSLSGGDLQSCRGLYKETATVFRPQAHSIAHTNTAPIIKAQDEGTWRRLRIIPFLARFIPEPDEKNPYHIKERSDIAERILVWKEAFMSMLVHKFYETKGHITTCKTVDEYSKQYRTSEDVISQFLLEHVQESTAENATLKQQELSNRFKQIKESQIYGYISFSIKDVVEAIDRKYENCIRYKNANTKAGKFWQGITLVYETEEPLEADAETPLPDADTQEKA